MSLNRVIRATVAGAFVMTMGAGLAFAADPKPKAAEAPKMDAQTQAMMAEMMKYATPGPEHKVFEPSIGKWKTVVKSWGGPGDPVVSEGTAESEWILGGRFIMSRYHGTMMGQPFEGFEVIGYDRKAGTYEGYWLDTMSTAFYPMTKGTWDEASKTLTFNVEWPNPMGQGNAPYKLATKFNGADSKTFMMSMLQAGKEMPMTEVAYTRMK